MILRTMLELESIILIVIGLIYEERLIQWENRMIRNFRLCLKKSIKKQQLVRQQTAMFLNEGRSPQTIWSHVLLQNY